MKLTIRINGERPDVFEGPEWDWTFHDSGIRVWNDKGLSLYYPYTTVYRTEVQSPQ